MSLRRQLLVSFGLQGAGAASVLLATLWLGADLGPEVQGAFSRTKSEIEFIAALAMFGLPQALFFHVKSGRLSGHAALRWVRWSTLLALPLGALYAGLQPVPVGAWSIALLGAAVGACVAHAQLRTLLLVRERTAWFNLMTALPQLLVLAGVAAVIAWGTASASTWFVLFAFAYGVAAALAWQRLSAAPNQIPSATPNAPVNVPLNVPLNAEAGWRELGRYGLAAWATAVLSTAAILAAQRWVEAAEGRAALGQFTLALTLVQVPMTPISYAAPLLFRHWMERPGAHMARRWAVALFALLLGAAAVVWGLGSVWPDLGLGAAYAGSTRALAMLLAGGAAEAAARLLAVQASASGWPWLAVRAEAARWSVLAIGAVLPLPHGLLPLCAVWAVAAGAAALIFLCHRPSEVMVARALR